MSQVGELIVTIQTYWQGEDGSGLQCFACGDRAWLRQSRLMVTIGSSEPVPTKDVLCGSCAELLESVIE